ncbi:PE family protein [Mycobacterium marinum]|nr:PE family protein [Mycobacterium marinum]
MSQMPHIAVAPDLVASAANQLERIGSVLSAANLAAAAIDNDGAGRRR